MVKPYYPRKETTPGTAVVIANSFNGSISRGFGRKAQSIADITGMQVYAYDRKGTGTRYTFAPSLRHELTPSRGVQNANWMADIICREFDSSVKDVILYGHSGAGPEMAALARTEKLPASALGLSDPVAVRNVGIVKGLAATAWYNAYHERQAKQQNPTEYNGSQLRFLRYKKAGRAIIEAFCYKDIWKSDFTLESILEIADNQPDLGVFTTFASTSLMGSPDFIGAVVDNINDLRPWGLHPIEASIWPNSVHSSFENPRIASAVVMRTLDIARPQPYAA